jgi:DNA polymerase-3 subunit beta
MKFIVSSTGLLKHLNQISGVLNTNNTLPILDHFLFEVEGNQMKVSLSDLETTMTTTLELDKSAKDGSFCAPAKILLDILKTFSEQPLSFDLDEKNLGIEISSDHGKYKVPGASADEFPKIPELDGGDEVAMSSSALFGGINKSLFATGNDEMRPIMSGILFEINEDNLTFVATDAHKLVKYVRSDVQAKKGSIFILPKKPNNLLKNLLSSMDEEVSMNYSSTNAHFSIGNVELICRLIDGKYPNYEAVIPKENPNKLTIDRQSFLNSLRRVSLFSNKTTHQIRLKFAGSELHISAEDLDFSNEASERLTCSYEGEDMEIGFNARFIVEMLSNLDAEQVSLEMSAPNRAGIIRPLDSTDDSEDVLMLVMPIMLNA